VIVSLLLMETLLVLLLVYYYNYYVGCHLIEDDFCRLGILVDFLSHSTITGFMGGTAIIICLQQLKGFFGLTHFTNKTVVISVMHAIFKNKNEVCRKTPRDNGPI
jgi:sulfate transporter 3